MDIKLPRLGEGAESGTVVSIFVKPGDQVKEGQTIVELENEKAVAPIPASASGRVDKLYVKQGDKISVGQSILALTENGGAATAEKAETPREVTRPTPAPIQQAMRQPVVAPSVDVIGELVSNVNVAASPTVRKIARALGIDLTRVRGSQNGGRIALEDLHTYIQRLQQLAFGQGVGSAETSAPKPVAEKIDFEKWGPVTRQPMSSLRKIIAQRMHESWAAVPRVTQFDEADITGIGALRKKYAAKYEKKGANLTLTPFLIKAVVVALKKHPIFNSSLDEATEEIVFKKLGLPVLRRCSGGGTVLQGPGCLNYALILEIRADSPLATISQANAFIMNRNRNALNSLLGGNVLIQGHTDLTFQGRKFSGNSQRRRRRFLLFHGSFLLNLDLALVAQALHTPSKQPTYRRDRSHKDFLTNLNLPADAVKEAMKHAWHATDAVAEIPETKIKQLVHERYATEAWNFKF